MSLTGIAAFDKIYAPKKKLLMGTGESWICYFLCLQNNVASCIDVSGPQIAKTIDCAGIGASVSSFLGS